MLLILQDPELDVDLRRRDTSNGHVHLCNLREEQASYAGALHRRQRNEMELCVRQHQLWTHQAPGQPLQAMV